MFEAGQSHGDLSRQYSADILAEMIVGTLNNVMTNWALDDGYPIFAKLEEARTLFDGILAQA